ncbi:hypothetical protein J2785_000894 [Burkholderia ambifaria]|uniref:hypothetical protein n=1 Tax=Burkholderia pyrrocinia TaxID=60550 RepID=UPI001FC84CC1|nr:MULTISPECIES: hypothetical protein [Burkholderia cepacia complex]MDR6497751.1 hypothetical protein [Burkholderia ambifaria]
MNRNPLKSGFAAYLLALSSMLSGAATACTIGEEALVQFPFNKTTFSNADRVTIANSAIEAKKWPDVKIKAIVIAGAYIHEKDIEKLKDARAENTISYLRKLGISAENIFVDKKTFTDEMVEKRPDGTVNIHQVIVEFTPICKGSCAWMCNDPRVTPRSKAIN